MADYFLDISSTLMCPHGGSVSISPGSSRVKVGGQAVASTADTFTIAGCSFTIPGPKPQPCTKVQWIVAATRVMIDHQPALLKSSTGLCQSADQIPAGPPQVSMTQVRAKGT